VSATDRADAGQPAGKDAVKAWLERSGFPLEMEAAVAFRQAGFEVRQSATFSDSQTDKAREIDVLASWPDFLGIIDVSFVLECKASSKPWVVLTSDNAFEGLSRISAFAITSRAAKSALAKRFRKKLGALEKYIKIPSRGGYALHQAFGPESNPAYAAAVSVLKACKSIVTNDENSPVHSFAFPLVIVDAPLFECSLDAKSRELQIVEVGASVFRFTAHVPERAGCCIRVITKKELEKSAEWAKTLAEAIFKELKPEQDKELSKMGADASEFKNLALSAWPNLRPKK
jgi:hypothetical protein